MGLPLEALAVAVGTSSVDKRRKKVSATCWSTRIQSPMLRFAQFSAFVVANSSSNFGVTGIVAYSKRQAWDASRGVDLVEETSR